MLIGGLLLLGGIGFALYRGYQPEVPHLQSQREKYKALPAESAAAQQKAADLLLQYGGFDSSIGAARAARNVEDVPAGGSMAAPIRAAFYVDWDAQAYTSLEQHIGKLNMVLPEWFFLDPAGDTLYSTIDPKALLLMKRAGIRVLPMLSNFFGEDFNGAVVHRILNSAPKRKRLINDLVTLLTHYRLQGINIDLEALEEDGDEPLIAFMQQLYERLHPLGFLVTQDVAPLNSDYNLVELSKWNDYIFLMSYDQHETGSAPGPVSEQKWIEATVDRSKKEGLPHGKIILCIAGYGYDWPAGGVGTDVTYEQALALARTAGAPVTFNNDTYNLNFSYTDAGGRKHEVYFTDAATNFNTLRFAAENNLAGTALWRLGSEDRRLWTFYNLDAMPAAVRKWDFSQLETVPASNTVDYLGEGEILDLLATPQEGKLTLEIDTTDLLISEEFYHKLPSSYVIRKWGAADKKIVLSFDDGPDEEYTPQILDILKREKIKAAFFVLGQNAERNIPLVKRIFREGHEIGNHSFSHPNMARISESRVLLELNATRLLIAAITGRSTVLFRPPYNADSEPTTAEELIPVALARQYNYLTIGENIDPNDWEAGATADSIFNRIVAQEETGNIILLHDAGGNREATVEALPRIIKHFRDKGYTFTTVGGLIGKTRDELMPPVPAGSPLRMTRFNYYLALAGYWGAKFWVALFGICILLLLLRTVALAILAVSERRKTRRQKALFGTVLPAETAPLVSILVPAYNESVSAVATVETLLKTTYPHFEILLIDDGSTDGTGEKIQQHFAGNTRVRVLRKTNGGKASALNLGIGESAGDFLLCIDADTQLAPDALSLMMAHFRNEKVYAVAGKVLVGNEVNLLTHWQHIEYVTSQNFERLAFARLNAITVVPGAIGAFRKTAVQAVGGYASDTLAEDCDLTIKLLRAGGIVAQEEAARSWTEAPETLSGLVSQRVRWTFGVMQTFWKNRDALFRRRQGALGWVALPNLLLFQFLLPLILPLADGLFILGLLTGAQFVWGYYLAFLLLDFLIGAIAFFMEGEKLWKLLLIVPQRLAYRWIMGFVFFKSLFRAIKGELQHWGAQRRSGRVTVPPVG